MKEIRVAYICHFSNPHIREKIVQKIHWSEKIIRRIFNKKNDIFCDYAVWNTNAINEMSKHENVEFFVICPAAFLASETQQFEVEGIHYFFFREEGVGIKAKLLDKLFRKNASEYLKNRKYIVDYISEIKPDIVHVVGAENPKYGLSALDISRMTPLIVQLQTLMSDPLFFENYSISKPEYDYRSAIEKKIISRADYVVTDAKQFLEIIIRDIKPNIQILNLSLALTEPVVKFKVDKLYDFVYFAADISKSCDLALEAFAIAHQRHPEITLDIVGGYTYDYYSSMQEIIKKNNLQNFVRFEGRLPTHDDVIHKIQESKFALLPMKIDLVSGTIRESMANGLPVVTTITQGTPTLNEGSECVLLSEIGNHEALAENMCRLIENNELVERLIKNGYQKALEKRSNKQIVDDWVVSYYNIVNKAI